MGPDQCPFCQRIEEGQITASTSLAVAFPDAYPISQGHMLVVPRRHEPEFFDLSPDEQGQMLVLAGDLHNRLVVELGFEGVNLGVNCGEVAGQTIAHAHLHFIPRYRGDVVEPAGGIRWLFPDKARYRVK
ncbi:MAG TPA: HIT family protein [Acidimicrobiales bacterium]|nr:HIT family protein [Acidimicrobiales bacterium]